MYAGVRTCGISGRLTEEGEGRFEGERGEKGRGTNAESEWEKETGMPGERENIGMGKRESAWWQREGATNGEGGWRTPLPPEFRDTITVQCACVSRSRNEQVWKWIRVCARASPSIWPYTNCYLRDFRRVCSLPAKSMWASVGDAPVKGVCIHRSYALAITVFREITSHLSSTVALGTRTE